jgi:SHS2 domain-containing protein
MKSFRLEGHIADVRLCIEGSTLEELLEAGVEGMSHILKKGLCRERQEYPLEFGISLTSPDTTSLLIEFLSDVLTISHINNAVICRVKFENVSAESLSCSVLGACVSSFDRDIKAVSYHEAEVVKDEKGNFKTNIIFDI